MGTSLTGLTPATTYDALIKVGDNGPLSATAKVLSDGLGNDSPIAMSTTLVGIGTATPDTLLHLSSPSGAAILRLERNDVTIVADESYGQVEWEGQDASGGAAGVRASVDVLATGTQGETAMVFRVSGANFAVNQERMRLTPNGLTFNGDTAAANALDDYEEGTWTPGISFGGASVGVTYNAANAGSYTKIGRQVTVNGYLILSNKGSSSGTARITGLPFTVANTIGTYCAATLRFSNITFTNQFQGFASINTTTVEFEEITLLGAVSAITNSDFANDSQVMVSLTYFTA
jgi:hypothetical protein